MPTYAVLLQYEVVSALVVDADNEEEAARIANEFESKAHEGVEDAGEVRVSSRLWGDGTLEVQEAEDEDDAEDLLDDWIDDLEDEIESDEDEDEDDELSDEDEESETVTAESDDDNDSDHNAETEDEVDESAPEDDAPERK